MVVVEEREEAELRVVVLLEMDWARVSQVRLMGLYTWLGEQEEMQRYPPMRYLPEAQAEHEEAVQFWQSTTLQVWQR